MSKFLMPVVDRSRFSTSWGQCQRKRFLQYHSVNGFGVQRKKQALPLGTGIEVHGILEELLKGERKEREECRRIITSAVEKYKEKALDSGILHLAEELNAEGNAEELRGVVEEQATLIEGLAWAAVRVLLPRIYADYEVVSVEQEEEYVLNCDCGLGEGSGSGDEHEARECGGIVLMSRPDLILRRKSDGALGYVEFKTSGDVGNFNWREQWEDNVQLALGAVGAEKRLGEEVSFCMVVGLNKGWRKRAYDTETKGYNGPKRQDSVFCYAYQKEANPPHWDEDWRTDFTYKDENGQNRTLKGKGYEKRSLSVAEFAFRPAGWTKMEYWVEWLEEERVAEEIVWVGPIPTPRHLVKDLLEALGAEEARWQERLFAIWDARNDPHKDQEKFYRKALNVNVPQSWECHRWGKKCSYLAVCRGDEEIQEADGTLKEGWQFRKPHHAREVKLMKEMGVEVPKEFGEEEKGDE